MVDFFFLSMIYLMYKIKKEEEDKNGRDLERY